MNICIVSIHNDNFKTMHVCPALLLSLFTLQIVIPFHTGNQQMLMGTFTNINYIGSQYG